MSSFICEKCGYISNSALRGTFWHASENIYAKEKGEQPHIMYKPQFSFYEDHRCCDRCAEGVEYSDGSGVLHPTYMIPEKDLKHFSEIGKDRLLELEAAKNGNVVNASYFFEKGYDKTVTPKGEAEWQKKPTN